MACDYALAVLDALPAVFPDGTVIVSPLQPATTVALHLKAICLPTSRYDRQRTTAIAQAVQRLERKSRSFHLASATFEGRLRIDLVLL